MTAFVLTEDWRDAGFLFNKELIKDSNLWRRLRWSLENVFRHWSKTSSVLRLFFSFYLLVSQNLKPTGNSSILSISLLPPRLLLLLISPFLKASRIFFFLDASTHLYKRLCPSVRPSMVIELRTMKMHRIFEISQIIASFHKVDAILHHS